MFFPPCQFLLSRDSNCIFITTARICFPWYTIQYTPVLRNINLMEFILRSVRSAFPYSYKNKMIKIGASRSGLVDLKRWMDGWISTGDSAKSPLCFRLL